MFQKRSDENVKKYNFKMTFTPYSNKKQTMKKEKSRAGRKPVLDKKIPVVLMVEGSRVIGKQTAKFLWT